MTPHPVLRDEDDERDDDRGDRRARQRDQVEDGDDERKRNRVIRADREEDDHRREAGDEADQEVAGGVAADRPVDVLADPAPARLLRLRQEPDEAARSVRVPSRSMKNVRNATVTTPTIPVTTPRRTSTAGPVSPRTPPAPCSSTAS